MEEALVEQAVRSQVARDITILFGEFWWVFFVLTAIMVFKETIKSVVMSFMVMRSGDYKVDDVVMLEGVPARIVRMGIWKTTFYVYRKSSSGTMFFMRRVIMNEQLPNLNIENPQERLDKLLPPELLASGDE